jgi:hypothetical protein
MGIEGGSNSLGFTDPEDSDFNLDPSDRRTDPRDDPLLGLYGLRDTGFVDGFSLDELEDRGADSELLSGLTALVDSVASRASYPQDQPIVFAANNLAGEVFNSVVNRIFSNPDFPQEDRRGEHLFGEDLARAAIDDILPNDQQDEPEISERVKLLQKFMAIDDDQVRESLSSEIIQEAERRRRQIGTELHKSGVREFLLFRLGVDVDQVKQDREDSLAASDKAREKHDRRRDIAKRVWFNGVGGGLVTLYAFNPAELSTPWRVGGIIVGAGYLGAGIKPIQAIRAIRNGAQVHTGDLARDKATGDTLGPDGEVVWSPNQAEQSAPDSLESLDPDETGSSPSDDTLSDLAAKVKLAEVEDGSPWLDGSADKPVVDAITGEDARKGSKIGLSETDSKPQSFSQASFTNRLIQTARESFDIAISRFENGDTTDTVSEINKPNRMKRLATAMGRNAYGKSGWLAVAGLGAGTLVLDRVSDAGLPTVVKVGLASATGLSILADRDERRKNGIQERIIRIRTGDHQDERQRLTDMGFELPPKSHSIDQEGNTVDLDGRVVLLAKSN